MWCGEIFLVNNSGQVIHTYVPEVSVQWLVLTHNFQGSILAASHLQVTLSNLLTYSVLRPTQPPTLHGIGWEMSSSLRAISWRACLVWLIRAVVCLLAANLESGCLLTWAMDGCIVCCGIIISCQSAATSEIVKALLVLSVSCKKCYSKYGTLLLPLLTGVWSWNHVFAYGVLVMHSSVWCVADLAVHRVLVFSLSS